MDKIKALRERLEELTDEAQAILNLAEKEDRDITTDEQKRWDAIMDEQSGELTKCQAELDVLEKRAAEQKRLAAQRRAAQRSVFDNALTEPQQAAAPRVGVVRAKLHAFKNDDSGRQAAYDCGQWLRAVLAHQRGYRDESAQNYAVNRFGGGIFATHTEGSNSAGGYTVPDPLSAAFIEYRELAGVSRQICDVRPMTSDTMSIPKLLTGNTVTYPGEASAITANDQTWGQIALTAVKRAVLTKVSNELSADSVINVVDQLVSRLAFQFALQEDNELINGDSTASYGGELGLLSASGAGGSYIAGGAANSGKDTWVEIVLADFTNTMGKLPSEHWAAPSWLCSPAFYYGVMLQVMASAGGNTIPLLESGSGRPMFLGYPVNLTDQMPTATAVTQKACLFGTFRDAVVLGDRETLQIAFSDQRYFDEDVIAVRGVTRYDINVHNASGASAAGAYVALVTSTT